LYDCAHLLLRLPLPPGSTGQLLPYTTLFRSDQRGDRAPPQHDHRRGGHLRMRLLASLAAAFLLRLGGPHPPYGAEVADGEAAALDRKSTRLNSSHVKTSYAVFCLNKKPPCSA